MLGAVLQPLLERFVSDHEAEALRFSHLLGALHVEAVEWDASRLGLCSAFFKRDEVELIVHAPVVAYGGTRAVLEHDLQAGRRCAADKKLGERGRNERRGRILRGRIGNLIRWEQSRYN